MHTFTTIDNFVHLKSIRRVFGYLYLYLLCRTFNLSSNSTLRQRISQDMNFFGPKNTRVQNMKMGKQHKTFRSISLYFRRDVNFASAVCDTDAPFFPIAIQGSSIRWAPGCENAAGTLRQKQQATAGTKLTKPWNGLIGEPCTHDAMLTCVVVLPRSLPLLFLFFWP